MPFDGRGPNNFKRRRFDDDHGQGHSHRGFRGRGRGRGRVRRDLERSEREENHYNKDDQPMIQEQQPINQEQTLPSRVIQIGQAEELTEDDIRAALEVFGELRGVVSPSRDMFLVEFSTLEQSIFLINHVESHGFLIRFITPDLRYGPAQDLPSAMATFTKSVSNAGGTNHVLEVNVLRPSYPITSEVLHTIASPHGKVQRIVIHNRNNTKIESLIEFDSIMSAETCKEAIHGADIYAGCCTLEVKYSQAQSLNVFKNDDDTFDYTDINPTIADRNRKRNSAGPQHPSNNAGGGGGYDHDRSYDEPMQGAHSSRRSSRGRLCDVGPANGSIPAVIMVHGLDSAMNPNRLFNLICMYGDVNKIKFLMTKKGIAMVEMKDSRGADNVLRYLNRVKLMGSQLSVSPSKHREVVVFGAPGILDDGSEALHVFIDSKLNRYSNTKRASKNRLVEPTKILHFFALPTQVDENFVLKLLEDKGCPIPSSISMHKNEICSAGLLEFDNTEEAVDTVAIANHINGTHKGNRYMLKMAFTGKKSMPNDHDHPAASKAGSEATNDAKSTRNFND